MLTYYCTMGGGNICNYLTTGPVVLKPGKMMHLIYLSQRLPALFMKHVLLLYECYTKPEVCMPK